jgi:hypothetical protein
VIFEMGFDMDREEGRRILVDRGWLSTTPVDFQREVLSLCRWEFLEAGEPMQSGGESSAS